MSVVKLINDYIEKKPYGEPFTSMELLKFGSRANIDQVLSRLVKAKKLTRVARGIFVKAEEKRYVEKVLPEPAKIAETIARGYGETVAVNGAEAARQLQLSSQVPTIPIFITSGATRRVKVGRTEIILKHVSHRKIVHAGTMVGLVISALWYLGKKQVNKQVIAQLKQKLSPKQFKSVQASTSSMPGWMADVFYRYQRESNHAQ